MHHRSVSKCIIYKFVCINLEDYPKIFILKIRCVAIYNLFKYIAVAIDVPICT